MNLTKTFVAFGCAVLLLGASALAADTKDSVAKKLTCCEEAAEKGKDCTHKCCVAAHHDKKSCERCNPAKQDLSLKKAGAKESAAQSK